MADKIVIRGANEHNLKNISVTIPRDKLVVITGVSGSGKSSLAFDTIYAEGQRRYVESLSAYARQFLEQMEKPEVELIEGLSPAISIEQKTTSRNPRSTVGTVTEIYDYMRLLFARIGDVHCYKCNLPISSLSSTQIVDRIMELDEGTKIQVLSPIVRDRKGEYRKELDQFRAKGFVRVRVDGQMRDLGEDIILEKKKKHTIELVVDRLVMKEGLRRRLADSVELALKMSDGLALVSINAEEEILFSERHACPNCDISYPELAPRMFSFNNPHGACPDCLGLGEMKRISPDLVVPVPRLSISQGAVKPWSRSTARYYHQTLSAVATHYGFSLDISFDKLPQRIQDIVLFGSGEEEIKFNLDSGKRQHIYEGPYEGVIPNLERRYKETDSAMVREELDEYMRLELCARCGGKRLRAEALAVTVGGKSIMEASSLSVKGGLEFFESVKLTTRQKHIGRRVIKEVVERLGFLRDVGLDYLTLDRAAATLSGGEGQRIRLATQIGSSLMGVLYILDEPSIGLHQRDNKRLIDTLIKLRDLGNTVIVVEHDEEMILVADHVLDLGPGAGVHGGEVVAEGTAEQIMKNKKSLTGQYLSGKLSIPTPAHRRHGNGKSISIRGASAHNLKSIDVDIPLGAFTCITGVSGSGKSTLLLDILYKALAAHFWSSHERPGAHKQLLGLEHIDKVIDIDQNPIGRTPRSNPATYTGVFTDIRDLFSNLPESRKRGYQPGRFSFNVKGGRCETCQGDGIIKIEMHFLPDVYVACEECGGHRFNRETLEVDYKGKSIADVLDMTVEEALVFFENHRSIEKTLATLNDVGMEYIKLGQSATTLSGGEAQRVKLSKELSKRSTGRTLYILDEPTTGLHFDDVRKLLKVLNRLTNSGNTLVIIEHNMDVIKTADYIIDLGPEGGEAGGYIVASGTPEEVAKVKKSQTGQALKKVLDRGH
ncbi:MAG: excinuclease ABC subunit UvrA [Nitrospinota bacterium]|nr:excinuclease ABC subunit UvrA [Nitrospinota bacterium]MDH5677116.1 excinuclease ABC subunit UvrA [Nitrospinota bacterium]MDH5755882.1 excinuclease ABC subunit UvrA [Nitrospinota bacterium]